MYHAVLASDNLLLETVNKCLEAQIELKDRIDGRGHNDPDPDTDHVAVPQKVNTDSMDNDTERDSVLVRQLREKVGALQSSLADAKRTMERSCHSQASNGKGQGMYEKTCLI